MRALLETKGLVIEIGLDGLARPAVSINGLQFDVELLEGMTKSMPPGDWFSVAERKDGVLTIRHQSDEQEEYAMLKKKLDWFIKELSAKIHSEWSGPGETLASVRSDIEERLNDYLEKNEEQNKNCSICEKPIASNHATVTDDQEEVHISCSAMLADGDSIDSEVQDD